MESLTLEDKVRKIDQLYREVAIEVGELLSNPNVEANREVSRVLTSYKNDFEAKSRNYNSKAYGSSMESIIIYIKFAKKLGLHK